MGQYIKTKVESVECVECEICNKVHLLDSKDFFTIYGNICVGTVGTDGGIVGNNFGEDDILARASVLCKSCLIGLLKNEDAKTSRKRIKDVI